MGADQKARYTLKRGQVLVAALTVLSIVLFVVWYASKGRGTQDETWARIQRDGVMRVGMDASYPPFEDYDEEGGQFVGFDVDLALEIGRRLNVEVAFINISFDGLLDAMYSGKVDAIVSALPYDPMLTKDVAYSHSYFNAGLVLLVPLGEERTRGVDDLSGRTVAVEMGSASHEEARRLRDHEGLDIILQTERAPEEVISKLIEGRVDAAIYDGISARQLTARGGPVQVAGDLLTDEPYVIATRLDSPELLRRINATLILLREEGYMEELGKVWF